MKLEITSGGKTWQWSPRDGVTGFTVGHRQGNDVVLADDTKVSNLHLRIDHFLRSWTFTDQMSDAGTLHNGEESSTGNLAEGDELKIGDSVLRILSLEHGGFPGAETTVTSAEFDVGGSADADFDVGGAESIDADISGPSQNYDRRQGQRGNYNPAEMRRGDYGVGDPGRGNYRRGRNEPEAPPPQQQQRPQQPPPPMQTHFPPPPPRKPGQKKSGAKGGLVALFIIIIVAFIMLAIGAEIMQDIRAGKIDEMERSEAIVRAEEQTELMRLYTELAAMSDTIQQMGSDVPTIERLKAVNELLAHPAMEHDELRTIRTSMSRMQGQLRGTLRGELRVSSFENSQEVQRLLSRRLTRQASEVLEAHVELLGSHPEYERIAETNRLLSNKENLRERIRNQNSEYLQQTLLNIDRELDENDYEAAAKSLTYLVEELIGNEATFARFRAELAQVQERAKAAADTPTPERVRPGNAPRNELTPQGELSARTALSAAESRLRDLYRDGGVVGSTVSLYGRQAEVLPQTEGSVRWNFRVRRPVLGAEPDAPEATLQYEVDLTYRQIPALTRVHLLAAIPNLKLQDHLGILQLCFNSNLNEEAMRRALTFQRAHPDVKDYLHAFLAAKLHMELPEGGFVEKDDRLAPPE
jgi:hypothetical protein